MVYEVNARVPATQGLSAWGSAVCQVAVRSREPGTGRLRLTAQKPLRDGWEGVLGGRLEAEWALSAEGKGDLVTEQGV